MRRMTRADFEHRNYSGLVQHPEDYEKASLPDWVSEDWWGPPSSQSVAYWATLDIQLAYPSVRLDELGTAIRTILSEQNDIFERLSGYPQAVISGLTDQNVYLEVADHLLTALRQVKVDRGSIRDDAWKPHHIDLPSDNKGIPTGLAISGLLLNAALYAADNKIFQYLRLQEFDSRGAFLRFRDDMTLLSRSTSGLNDLIEEVWRGVSGDAQARLDVHESKNGLFLNLSKTGPEAIRDVMVEYLRHQGWQKCCAIEAKGKNSSRDKVIDHDDVCEELLPPNNPRDPLSMSDWWTSCDKDEKERRRIEPYWNAVERSAVGPHQVGPFVTTLVERLSEIGRDTLGDRFGEGARSRLVQLHDLARFDIVDEQVRPDTRRSFAVNRLVSAWLSSDTKEARAQLADIRASVADVVQQTPWKFALWRAVVRAAARRPPHTGDSPERSDDVTAQKWLMTQLSKIATMPSDSEDGKNWLKVWPEVEPAKSHKKHGSWRRLYLSFLRTAFWNALADTLLSLHRYHDQNSNPRGGDAGLSPRIWVVRAIPNGNYGHVVEQLGTLDHWAEALYSRDPDRTDLTVFPWELDSLVIAVLASKQRHEIARAWLHGKTSGKTVMIPEALGLPKDSVVFHILERGLRIWPRESKSTLLNKHALAHVRLGGQDSRLGDVLFPSTQSPQITRALERPRFVVSVAGSLGCSGSIAPSFVARIMPTLANLDQWIPTFRKDPLFLSEYGYVRRLLLGSKEWVGVAPTLHRLLWGIPAEKCELSDWRIRAWEIPAVGLPSRVATFLFRSVENSEESNCADSVVVPTTWKILTHDDSIAEGRMLQFEGDDDLQVIDRAIKCSLQRTFDWEIPPHPAYFVPFLTGNPSSTMHRPSFRLYCDVLLLLTAMDGGENILRNIAESEVSPIPFDDRWDWRSRIHLSAETWKFIEAAIRWAFTPAYDTQAIQASLSDSISSHAPDVPSIDDFRLERIDLLLDACRDMEVVRVIRNAGPNDGDLPSELHLRENALSNNLNVRIGQIAVWPSRENIINDFPRIGFRTRDEIMQQVFRVFSAPPNCNTCPNTDAVPGDLDLVVIPEVAVPVSEVGAVRQHVKNTGRSSVAGLFWRELSPVYRDYRNSIPSRRWFVNQAELVVSMNHGQRGPNFVRWYRVGKVLPAHIEVGFAQALSSKFKGAKWTMIKGRRWYRFVHRHWGDFSIAICADLLDSAPWRSLRGELLHLFMVSYNADIGLYEALTWIRAYESYVNLVAVNHGMYGGSFIWTPRRRHSREIATLRGPELFLFADVQLPIRDLAKAQREGVQQAVARHMKEWICNESDTSLYKSPPPGFIRRLI